MIGDFGLFTTCDEAEIAINTKNTAAISLYIPRMLLFFKRKFSVIIENILS